jgi:lysozyme
MSKKTAATAGLSAAALAIAAALIGGFEGKRNQPYRDPVGILTVCYGHTGKDIEQRKYTDEECLALLEQAIAQHADALACIKTPLQLREQIAFVSLAFNIGTAKFCGGSGYKTSTVVKKANAGDMAGACAAMSAWRNGCKAGKCSPLPGLVKRRAVERAVCEGDFDEAARIVKAWGLPGMTYDAIYEIAEAEEQSVDNRCECVESAQ